ncbi:hypothetical protein BH20ACT9_BH20ACT9_03380 [soil metagenome]
MVSALSRATRVALREMALEAGAREAATVVVPFVVATVVLAGLGLGPRPDVLRAVAPGVSWLVVVFAAVPLARSVAAAEREEGCWDLLRGLVPASALLWGKVAALWMWLAATWCVATLLTVALFNARTTATGALAGALGALGLAAVTVTFGAIIGAERRSGMLAVLLLPAGLPALLAGTQASTAGVDAGAWIALLAAYDLITLAVAWAAFPVLLEG